MTEPPRADQRPPTPGQRPSRCVCECLANVCDAAVHDIWRKTPPTNRLEYSGKFATFGGVRDLLDAISDPVVVVSDRLEPSSDPIDPVVDLIRRNDAEIAGAEAWLSTLNQQVTSVKRLLSDLNRERATLEQMARRSGVDAPTGPARPSRTPNWIEMPRVQAVQQVLDEATGPLHLQEIEAALRSHGRGNDDVALISATLAYLKRRRGSVTSMGAGCWVSASVGTRVPPAAVTPPRAVPSLSDF